MKQLDILRALKALIAAALPTAQIGGFDEDVQVPEAVGPGGAVFGVPGEPGEPEIDLSPITYNFEHDIDIEVAAPGAAPGDTLAAMLAAIGTAIAADRTLGGLCHWVEAGGATFRERVTDNASPNWADFPITVSYSTTDVLG